MEGEVSLVEAVHVTVTIQPIKLVIAGAPDTPAFYLRTVTVLVPN